MKNHTVNPKEEIKFRLQTKFLISILLLEAMLMSAIILVVENQMRESILDEFLKRGLSVTRNLAAVNIDFVATYNYVKIEQNLERVVNENSLLYATVVFFDGEVASYKGQEKMKSVLSGPLYERAQEINDTLIQYEKIQGEEFCDIAVPIFLKGENWGTVRTGFSLDDMHAAVVNTRKVLLCLGGIGLFCGWLASVFLARRITRPIDHLVESVKAIANGEYDRFIESSTDNDIAFTPHWFGLANRFAPVVWTRILPIGRGDELGVLARAFLHMSRQLKQTHEQLEEYARSLEEKVGVRTEALQREIHDRLLAETALQEANEELRRLANRDGLTQIANRRCFDEFLTTEWQRLSRERLPLSLVLCDVDYFKLYNDTYGHQAGDECLQQVAKTLGRVIRRPADLVARYGGEEFVAILSNTGFDGTIAIAEAIQQAIKELEILHAESEVSDYLTLSIGVSCIVPSAEYSPNDLVAFADQALYSAKIQGRNRYCVNNFPTMNATHSASPIEQRQANKGCSAVN